MIQGNNYRLIAYIEELSDVVYNRVALANAERFGVHDQIKKRLLDERHSGFMRKLVKHLNGLGLSQDIRNLNLQFQEFSGDPILKHTVLTFGRTKLRLNDLFDNHEDNAEFINSHTEKINTVVRTMLTHINPRVKELVGLAKRGLSKSIAASEVSGFKVIQVVMPSFVQSLADEDQLVLDSSLNVHIDLDFSNLDYRDYLTGHTATASDEMNAYLASYTNEQLQELWTRYFGNISPTNKEWVNLINVGKYDRYSDVFALFCLFTNMIDNKINSSLGLVEHNLLISRVLNILRNVMSQKLTIFTNELLNDKIISKVDGKDIYVNEIIFNKALNAGVTVDTIFGAVLSDDRYNTVDDLKVNNDKLTASATSYFSQQKILNKRKFANQNIILISQVITNWARDNDISDETIRCVINNLDEDDLNNIEKTMKEIVLAFENSPLLDAFYHTVKELVENMDVKDSDINFYAALASYDVIISLTIGNIALSR